MGFFVVDAWKRNDFAKSGNFFRLKDVRRILAICDAHEHRTAIVRLSDADTAFIPTAKDARKTDKFCKLTCPKQS